MADNASGMGGFDFGKSFSYVFQDPDWVKKVLLGGVIMLIPLLGPFWVLGYGARLARRYVAGEENPLPDWDAAGEDIGTGFKIFGVALIYSLPFVLIFGGLAVAMAIAIESGAKIDDDAIGAMSLGINCLSIPISLVMTVWMPAPMMHVGITGEFSSAFEFKKLWAFIRNNPTPYALAIAVGLLSQMAAVLGYLACIIGVFVTIAWAMMVQWHAYGQAWRLSYGGGEATVKTFE